MIPGRRRNFAVQRTGARVARSAAAERMALAVISAHYYSF